MTGALPGDDLTEPRRPPEIGVGMPAWLLLNQYARILRDAFGGAVPYLVGTAATSKTWRDVDVRTILTAAEWRRYVGKGEVMCRGPYYECRTAALTLAFSTLGREMTGLPIDWQLQTARHAERYVGPRFSLGIEVVVP